jgi:hypothetical protein
MKTADAISHRICPDCSVEIPVYEDIRTWCEHCDWNIGNETPRADEGFLADRYGLYPEEDAHQEPLHVKSPVCSRKIWAQH